VSNALEMYPADVPYHGGIWIARAKLRFLHFWGGFLFLNSRRRTMGNDMLLLMFSFSIWAWCRGP
jgi:hypothetical protein